jgi:hypothetical protein
MDILEVFNRPLALSFVDKNPELKTIFQDAGVFVTTGEIANALNGRQSVIAVPHLLEPDYNLESNYSNTIYNDIAEPRTLEFTSTTARIAYLNEGWVASALEQQLSGINPNQLVAARANKYWTAQVQLRTIASALGLYNANKANATLVNKTATPFSVEAFVATRDTGLSAKGVMVTSTANKTKMTLAQLQIPGANPNDVKTVEVYNGYIVVANDKFAKLADGSTLTTLFGQGAFVAASKPNSRDMRVETSESRANGGGVDTLWTRRDVLVHPQGYDFTSAKITGGTKNQALSASFEDLQDASNWVLKGSAEDTAVRFLVTKG